MAGSLTDTTFPPIDIVIKRGDSWGHVITIKDQAGAVVNVTGWTVTLKALASWTDRTAILNMTSSGSGITLGGTAGTITLRLTPSQTAELPAPSGVVFRWPQSRHPYELLCTDAGGNKTTRMRGDLIIMERAA